MGHLERGILNVAPNFVGSESCQKQSVKLLQNMVHSTFQLPSPPPTPQSHTVCIYCTLRRGGGGRRHGGTWSNRTYVALALFSLLATCVVFEVEFLEEIQTEVLRVFLLAIHRHVY